MLSLLYLSTMPSNYLVLASSLIRSKKTETTQHSIKKRNTERYKMHNKRDDATEKQEKTSKNKPKSTHIPDDEARCIAITRKGERCKMSKKTNNYCQFHRLPVSQVELKEETPNA